MAHPYSPCPAITQQSHGPTQRLGNTTRAAMQPFLGGQRATALPTGQSVLEFNNRLVDGGAKGTEAKNVGTNAETDAGPRVDKQRGQRRLEDVKQTLKDQHYVRTNWAQHINKYDPKTKLEDMHAKDILQLMCRHHLIGTFVGASADAICHVNEGAVPRTTTKLMAVQPEDPTHGLVKKTAQQPLSMATACRGTPWAQLAKALATTWKMANNSNATLHAHKDAQRSPNTRTGTCTRKTRYELSHGTRDLQSMCRTNKSPPETNINQCSRNKGHGKTDGERGQKPTCQP